MKYMLNVTCKLCYTKLDKDNPSCKCGNVAISRITAIPHGLVVYVNDLKTIQFSKLYYTTGGNAIKVDVPLQPKYQWNWSIVNDITLHKKFTHWLMPVSPLFIFSGEKFMFYFKRWVKNGFEWFSRHKNNNYEEVFANIKEKTPF